MGINYGKWSAILGIPIALVGTITTVIVVPDIGCRVGLNLSSCAVPLKDVELLTQSEAGEFLAGVKIQFMAKGAPEVQYTDDNGYAKVKIPSQGDIRVNLHKKGYPVQEFIINLENPEPPLRVIKFTKSGKPQVTSTQPQATPADAPVAINPPPANPQPPTSAHSQSNNDLLFQFKSCVRGNEILKCDFLITDQKENRRLTIYADDPSKVQRVQSAIVDPQRNQYVAKSVEFSNDSDTFRVQGNLMQGMGLKASISFENVPTQINRLTVFQVSANIENQDIFKIQFHDVPISN